SAWRCWGARARAEPLQEQRTKPFPGDGRQPAGPWPAGRLGLGEDGRLRGGVAGPNCPLCHAANIQPWIKFDMARLCARGTTSAIDRRDDSLPVLAASQNAKDHNVNVPMVDDEVALVDVDADGWG